MPAQEKYMKKRAYGGTMRLGAWKAKVKRGTKAYRIYSKYDSFIDKSKGLTSERHRHRYEFNNTFRTKFEENGFSISGSSPDGLLVEAVELVDHPFFVATQYHPEYLSRPLTPHPIFMGFMSAASK